MGELDDKKTTSWQMFNRISQRYDLLNRLLSARRDVAWRKKCARMLPKQPGLRVLDLATGTADLLLALLQERPDIVLAAGLDPAMEMLKIGKDKCDTKNAAVSLVNGDAQHLSLKTGSIDVMTMAFGIRNVANIEKAFAEMHRVLADHGRLLILEFSLPTNWLIRRIYLLYFRRVLPVIGGLLSGDRQAYSYLNRTVEDFPYGEAFCQKLTDAGFLQTSALPLTFGIASIYSAEKRNTT